MEEYLLNKVKEKGIVKMILDYRNQIELSDKLNKLNKDFNDNVHIIHCDNLTMNVIYKKYDIYGVKKTTFYENDYYRRLRYNSITRYEISYFEYLNINGSYKYLP
jgi:hypothetical protein